MSKRQQRREARGIARLEKKYGGKGWRRQSCKRKLSGKPSEPRVPSFARIAIG